MSACLELMKQDEIDHEGSELVSSLNEIMGFQGINWLLERLQVIATGLGGHVASNVTRVNIPAEVRNPPNSSQRYLRDYLVLNDLQNLIWAIMREIRQLKNQL